MLALLARSDESPPTPAPPELPLYAGFGISTPEHARAAAEIVDGVIVGSRAIEVAGGGHEAQLSDGEADLYDDARRVG